jgi:hypothetical protein
VCHARLHQKLVRVLLGFRLGLRVRDSVGGPVVVTRQTLQPSSRCPMGSDRSHTSSDVFPTSSWYECARGAGQASDRACFSCLSGSNPRSTSYAHMPMQNDQLCSHTVCRERTPMMMFTMGWWFTVVHPSLNTVAARSLAISLIFPCSFRRSTCRVLG